MRLRKRAVGMLFGAGLLFLLGTNVQAGWLLVLSALLLGTLVAGVVLPVREVRGIHVERRAPEELGQGEEATVALELSNRSRNVRLSLLVEDGHLSPARVFVDRLRPGERAELSTTRSARRRGLHRSTAVSVRSSAPFGVAERRRTVSVDGSTLVVPAVVALGATPFAQAVATAERAIHTTPRRGAGPEYLGVREYRPGDSMRHVHWPSTARLGSVMVREFEIEHTRRLALVLDTSADAGEPPTPLDRCCTAASSIAMAAASQGQGTRLVAAGRDGLDEIDRADEREILRWLALLAPSDAPFEETVRAAGSEMDGADTVVLAFPTWRANASEALVAAVGELAAEVPLVVAIPVVAPAEHRGRAAALRPGEVSALSARLTDVGADVYPWGIGEDLSTCLAEGGAWA